MTEEALRGRIAYDGTRTPLKTVLFLLVCLAWLVPGLAGHDPWKVDEAVSFGVVHEMLRTGDWVGMRIAGELALEKAPLFLWTSAAFAKALGGLMPLHDAARLAAALYMAIVLAGISATSLQLMRDRAVRVSVLLFIGCLGLLIRAHEMTTELAGLAGMAVALHGLAVALKKPWIGGAITGAGMGVAFLGDGILPLAMLLALLAILPLFGTAWRGRGHLRTVAAALVVAAPLVALWPLMLAAASPGYLALWLSAAVPGAAAVDPQRGAALVYFLKTLPWYAWPAWPLALWTLWRWRRVLRGRRDVQLLLAAFAAFFVVGGILAEPIDVNVMPLLLPLAILGVAELENVPRGAASALDWFGMTTFFLLAALIWVGWAAAVTGQPEFARAWLQREVPGFTYQFRFLSVALAALLTLVWLVVVARSLRSTRRAVVNWAAGITMVWMLVMTLGVPLVDQARSYRGVATQVALHLPVPVRCVARHNVGDAQRALLDYFINLRTVALQSPASAACGALLVQGTRAGLPPVGPEWTEVWRGSRPGDRHEFFALFRRG